MQRSIGLMRWAVLAAVLLLMTGAGASVARAEDVMWGALILAENPPKDGPPKEGPAKEGQTKVNSRWPAALAGREKQISRIFGYKQLRVLGQAQQKIKTGEEDWLLPSKRFYVKVDTKYPIPHGYLVNLQLYLDERMLVEANVKLARNTPLYIRGPQVGSGQLIIALQCGAKDAAETKAKPATAHPAANSTPAAAPAPAANPATAPASAPPPDATPSSEAAKPTATQAPATKA